MEGVPFRIKHLSKAINLDTSDKISFISTKQSMAHSIKPSLFNFLLLLRLKIWSNRLYKEYHNLLRGEKVITLKSTSIYNDYLNCIIKKKPLT